ncbi:MAG: hypothetical protein ACNYVW_09790, partial [Methanosarcinales archaeon]
ILENKTSAYETALSRELKLAEDYKDKQAKVDKLKADKTIEEWDRVVEAIKANPAEAEIHIKKYMEGRDITIPETTTPTTPIDWETGSPSWEGGIGGVPDFSLPAVSNEEGPQHIAWQEDLDTKKSEITTHNAKMSNWRLAGMEETWLTIKEQLQGERDDIRNREPAFTAHSGGIIPEAGIYRIEMEKGEKIIPLSKQQPTEQKTSIMVKVEAVINNYSDIERLEYLIGESVARGIHNKVGLR